MFSYWLMKWRFLRAFQAEGDGFLYRRNLRSAPIFVTADERRDFIRSFRKQYWKQQAFLWGGLVAVICCLVGAAFILSPNEMIFKASGYAIAFGMMAAIFIGQRRLLDKPERQLAGRAPAALARTSGEVLTDRLSKTSWTSLTIRGLILLALAAVTFPRGTAPGWWTFAWIGYFGLCLLLLARNGWMKAKLKPKNPA